MMTAASFLDHLLQLPAIPSALMSPDRRWAAFAWPRRRVYSDVFAVDLLCENHPVIALTATRQNTRLVSWLPDSSGVIVAEDLDGDEKARLYRVEIHRPEILQPLTSPRPAGFIRGGTLSPDGRFLYYGMNYDPDREQVIEPTWMFRQDLSSGELKVIARPQRTGWEQPELDRSGRFLIYGSRAYHPAGRQFHLVDLETLTDSEILNAGADRKVFARWFSDGARLLVIAEAGARDREYTRLGVLDLATNRLEWLIDDPARMIQGGWPAADGWVIVNEITNARRTPSRIHIATREEVRFPAVQGNLLPLGKTANGRWLSIFYSATRPDTLVTLTDAAQEKAALTFLFPAEDAGYTLCPAEEIRWRSADGILIQGWLYRTSHNQQKAVMLVHGGPTMHYEDRVHPLIQYLVQEGFNVLVPNYRGSTGFGLTFQHLIREDGWGGREQEDLLGGVRELFRLGLALPGQVGVTGTSYGGYSAWYLATHAPPDLIAAAAPICGMTDLRLDYETTRPDLRPMTAEMMGGTPDEIPEKYDQRSPIHMVDRIRIPLFIVQGLRDPNVTPANTRLIVERLEANQIRYQLLEFADEGHGIIRPENQRRLYPQLADFFRRSLVSR